MHSILDLTVVQGGFIGDFCSEHDSCERLKITIFTLLISLDELSIPKRFNKNKNRIIVMNIRIKRLDSTTTNDYLSFFENIAVIDKAECGKCYCMFFHTDEKAKEWVNRTNNDNRNDVIENIKRGTLSGFLAYDGNNPIAWCNVNERNSYKFNKT